MILDKLKLKWKKWWYPGNPKGLKVSGSPPYYFLIDESEDFNGRCTIINYHSGESENYIEFNLAGSYPESPEFFPVYFTYIELEELTHWAGERNVDEEHSYRWLDTLSQLAAESMDMGFIVKCRGELRTYSP